MTRLFHPRAIDGAAIGGGSGATVADVLAGGRFLLAAHRGDIGSADSYPENTVEAFKQAARKGIAIIETDVQQSADGTWWIMHDSTVDRTTNGTGTIASKTDAQMAALAIDGGYGYNAGRHGTTLRVPKLLDVLDALEPYGALLTPELIVGDATALAQAVVDAGHGARVIIEVHSTTDATAVKAVDSTLTTLVNQAVSTTHADVDWLSWDIGSIGSLAAVEAVAPKVVKSYAGIAAYGADETAYFQNALARGARVFQTNNVDAALDLYERFVTIADHLAATDPHTQYQREAEKGVANGYASLGADGLVPASQLPDLGAGSTHREVAMADFGTGLEPVSDASGDWQYGTYAGV